MIVYSNSCSYGVLSTGKTYSDFIGDKLNSKVINAGMPGCCNERIFRTSTRDLLELKENNEKILALISLSSFYRSEIWYDNIPALNNDGHFKSFQVNNLNNDNSHRSKLPTIEAEMYAKNWFLLHNDEAESSNLFYKLNLFTTFLEHKDIQYLIWAGPMTLKQVDFGTPFIKPFYKHIANNKNIINLYDFSFSKYCSIIKKHEPYDSDQFGIYGHHAEQAHEDFAEYLLEAYLNEI